MTEEEEPVKTKEEEEPVIFDGGGTCEELRTKTISYFSRKNRRGGRRILFLFFLKREITRAHFSVVPQSPL